MNNKHNNKNKWKVMFCMNSKLRHLIRNINIVRNIKINMKNINNKIKNTVNKKKKKIIRINKHWNYL